MRNGIAAQTVRTALDERGMTIKELSRRAGVDYHTVWNGIKGITAMQSVHFLRYAEVLEIDLLKAVLNGKVNSTNLRTSQNPLQQEKYIKNLS